MNFQELLAKMQQLDQPASTIEQVTDEMGCGDSPMPVPSNEPPVAPPSMSINLNAQGMDNIEDLMKLVTKVNPDMDKSNLPPLPSMGDMPSIASIKPAMPPLKMLPDLSDEPHSEPDGDEAPKIKGLDQDGDGDHDMRDHDMEKKDKEEATDTDEEDDDIMTHLNKKLKPFDDQQEKDKEEAYGNSLGDSEPEIMGFKAAMPDGDDLSKPKKSYSDKPYRGDNPMSTESTDLRAQIRADLQRRLNEAKKS